MARALNAEPPRDGWFGGGRPPSVTAHCRCARRQYRAAEREGLVGVVRIGTWNLESLFRPGGAAGPRTDAAYQAKLAALAAVINVMAPDLLAVQEVGDPAALVDLAELAEGGWQCPTADPDGRGIRVGFVSRLPLADVEQVRMFPAGLRPVQVDRAAINLDAGP